MNLWKLARSRLKDDVMVSRPTYTRLFQLLWDLGFDKAEPRPTQWTWSHEPSETVLLFSLDEEDTDHEVSEADFASVEAHLRGKGVITQPLEELLRVAPQRSSQKRHQRDV